MTSFGPSFLIVVLIAQAESTSSGGTAVEFTAITAGEEHTCALSRSGDAYCWGDSDFGALGVGPGVRRLSRPAPVVGGLEFTTISAGAHHTCGVTKDGTAYCWGLNQLLQLGTRPTEVCERRMGGVSPCSWTPIAVQGGLRFREVAAGSDHTCGLTTDSLAYCWGAGDRGQRGAISTEFCRPDGYRRYGRAGVACGLATPVSGDPRFATLAVGADHACGLTAEGAAYCWGSNFQGQLGAASGDRCVTWRRPGPPPEAEPCSMGPIRVTGEQRLESLTAGTAHTCGVTAAGELYCWGVGDQGQIGAAATDRCSGHYACRETPSRVAEAFAFGWVAAGDSRTCGVLEDGSAVCWGARGALGHQSRAIPPDTTCEEWCVATPLRVAGDHVFQELSLGAEHTCGVTTAGVAYCWGRNTYNALGAGELPRDKEVPKRVLDPTAVRGPSYVVQARFAQARPTRGDTLELPGYAYAIYEWTRFRQPPSEPTVWIAATRTPQLNAVYRSLPPRPDLAGRTRELGPALPYEIRLNLGTERPRCWSRAEVRCAVQLALPDPYLAALPPAYEPLAWHVPEVGSERGSQGLRPLESRFDPAAGALRVLLTDSTFHLVREAEDSTYEGVVFVGSGPSWRARASGPIGANGGAVELEGFARAVFYAGVFDTVRTVELVAMPIPETLDAAEPPEGSIWAGYRIAVRLDSVGPATGVDLVLDLPGPFTSTPAPEAEIAVWIRDAAGSELRMLPSALDRERGKLRLRLTPSDFGARSTPDRIEAAVQLGAIARPAVGARVDRAVETVVPAEGGVVELPGVGSVSFGAGAFEGDRHVELVAEAKPRVREPLERQARPERWGAPLPYELTLGTGDSGPAGDVRVTIRLPSDYRQSMPADQTAIIHAASFAVAADGQRLVSFFPLDTQVEAGGELISAQLPPAFFQQRRDGSGFEAVVVPIALMAPAEGVGRPAYTTAIIGADGGTVRLEGLASAEFPAGAFDRPRPVSIIVTDKPHDPGLLKFSLLSPFVALPYEIRVSAGHEAPQADFVLNLVLPVEFRAKVDTLGAPRVGVLGETGGSMETLLEYLPASTTYDAASGTVRATIDTYGFRHYLLRPRREAIVVVYWYSNR